VYLGTEFAPRYRILCVYVICYTYMLSSSADYHEFLRFKQGEDMCILVYTIYLGTKQGTSPQDKMSSKTGPAFHMFRSQDSQSNGTCNGSLILSIRMLATDC